MNIILALDWIAALVVIYCIWTGFKCKRDWIIYATACAVYIIISVYKELYGLAVLNTFATIFAARHAIKKKGE